jgi:hypothetical protein
MTNPESFLGCSTAELIWREGKIESRYISCQRKRDIMLEPRPDLRLEIAHVLFIDIVGYSKLLINEQHELLQKLNEIVRGAEAFQQAETTRKLIRIPTGDGMALVFRRRPMRRCRAL